MSRFAHRGVAVGTALALCGLWLRDGAATAPTPVFVPPGTLLRYVTSGSASWSRLAAQPGAPGDDGAWRLSGYDDHAWDSGAGPLGPLAAAQAAAVATSTDLPFAVAPPTPPGPSVLSLYARVPFDAPDAATLRGLRLTCVYQDGIAAWVNGVEIARNNLAPGARSDTPAESSHGLAPETFYVAVPAGLVKPHGNLLAVEVHAFGLHSAPILDVNLAGAEAPTLIRGPYLARVGQNAATVVFDTDLPTPAEVDWGPTPAYGESVTLGAATHQVVDLGARHPLATDAPVHYRVRAGASDSGDLVFHPLPPRGEPVRFAVYGDVRTGDEYHAELVSEVTADAPDFAVVLGDLVARGDDEGDWQKYFAISGPLLEVLPTFPAAGNHEYGEDGDLRFLDLFPMPGGGPEAGIYSFDAGDAHVAVLDSSRSGSKVQAAWLDADLARARASGARVLFVAMHAGPYSHGEHGPDLVAIKTLVPILKKHDVAMVFSGHDHDFERGVAGSLPYVVTGGGGAPLYQNACTSPSRCPGKVLFFASEHNYVTVDVAGESFRLCPRRLDGTALEACTSYDFTGASTPVARR